MPGRAPLPLPCPTIVVSGLRSGIGKTLLAERLVRVARPAAAIKVTIHTGPPAVIDDPAVLAVPGKDTDRLYRSGARPVLWIRSSEHDLEQSLRDALSRVRAMISRAMKW